MNKVEFQKLLEERGWRVAIVERDGGEDCSSRFLLLRDGVPAGRSLEVSGFDDDCENWGVIFEMFEDVQDVVGNDKI